MEELTTLPEYLKASNADGLAILEATAVWCSQCKAISPFVRHVGPSLSKIHFLTENLKVDKLITKYPKARFYKYDTDVALDITQELGATHMPSFHIFKDGDLKGSITGAKAQELEKAISENYDGKVEE